MSLPSMSTNMGTQPTSSSSDSSSSTAPSASLDGRGDLPVTSGQLPFVGSPEAHMGCANFNPYEKVGHVYSLVKDSGMWFRCDWRSHGHLVVEIGTQFLLEVQKKRQPGDVYGHASNHYGDVHSSALLACDRSPSPPLPPRVYKPCVVCNDKSSGYHYGVSSCEGCKGFFRRSVQKNMQYMCHKDKSCVINKVTRNRCQYCRLQKCFAMGMSKEAVRNDRSKKKKQKPESSSNISEELTEDDQMLLQEVLDAHRDTTPSSLSTGALSGSKTEEGASTAAPLTSITEPSSAEGSSESSSVFLWEKITELSSAGIVLIVDFAKKIPGFLSLSTSDQITLLKAACLEIMILRISIRYHLDTDTMQFSNGLSLTRENLQKGGFGPLTPTIFSFAASLKRMNCDETEYAMLSSICLISGDRSGLHDTEKIEQLQEPLLEALKHYIRSRRPDERHTFANMLMKLTDLRSISVRGAEKVLNLRLERYANLPPIVVEMLERVENVRLP